VEQGSMVKAAERLDLSRSMVSRYLNTMESWAGSRLLYRSTRRLALTDIGQKVLKECYKIQSIEREVKFSSAAPNDLPQGRLRIATSPFFAEQILAPFSREYLIKYPQVSLDLRVSNQSVNLVEERIDLAIRITDELDPTIIARKFGELNSIVCASPQYLAQRGTPPEISHLQHHNCLTYSYYGKSVWEFKKQDRFESVQVSGNLSADDPKALLKSSLLGSGITLQPKYAVQPYIEEAKLVHLFPDYTPKTLGIYGIYKSRDYMPKAMRVFIDDFATYIATLEL
ncbi:MAG: LysR family transcriptional regulator, partial [Pseudomonadales bacterium]